MQGGIGDCYAAHQHRLEARYRCQRARATDLHIDTEHTRAAFVGWKFKRHRPARCAGDEAELVLLLKRIDLVDDAVDFVAEFGATRAEPLVIVETLLDARHYSTLR